MRYTVFDLECSTGVLHKRKASPYLHTNQVVMLGYKRKGGESIAVDYPEPGWFKELLAGTTVLIGFNVKFDLLFATRHAVDYEAFQDYIVRGGVVWDCQLAEFLLDGMCRESHMLALDEVAPRYGGKVKIDEVKALWEAGVKTEDIDSGLLRRYLIGDGQGNGGDIGNTEAAFLGQYERARKAGQMKSILLNMGALVCTMEMEKNGLYVDKAAAVEYALELYEKLDERKQEVDAFIPADLPFEFNWNSTRHKSALIFGGTVGYKAKAPKLDADGKPTYYSKEITEPVLEDGKPVVYKSGKNKGEIKTRKTKVPDLDRPVVTLQEFEYTFPGYTEPDKKWAGATPGVYSVSEDVLEELGARNVPFLKALGAMTKLGKDIGTYYQTRLQEGKDQKGMLTLVGDDNIVHHQLNMVNTVTARLSSSNPNAQNINNAGRIKEFFRSRWGDEGAFISSDFTSLEVYGQALLSGDAQLIADLRAGLDMHCKRLSVVEGMPYDEVLALAKGKGTKLPEWEEKRKKIKEFSFQLAYGAGAASIAAGLDLPVETIQSWMDTNDSMYPGVGRYYEALTNAVKRSRVPTSRIEFHPAVRGARVQLGRGSYRTPDNKLYVYDEQCSPEYLAKRGMLASFSPTQIKNYVVQGTGGEWMKATMWLLVREFYRNKNFGGKALLINTVHDAAYVDAHKSVAMRATYLLHACMEEASTFMEYWFDWQVPVPTPCETGMGPNWASEHTIYPNKDKLYPIKQYLRDTYMGGYQPSFEEST